MNIKTSVNLFRLKKVSPNSMLLFKNLNGTVFRILQNKIKLIDDRGLYFHFWFCLILSKTFTCTCIHALAKGWYLSFAAHILHTTCPSVCSFVCLFVNLSVRQSVCSSICLFVCLSGNFNSLFSCSTKQSNFIFGKEVESCHLLGESKNVF